MTIDRDALRRSLKAHEGCRLRAYLDTVGKVTLGYGHNASDVPISQRAADTILEDDMDAAMAALDRALPWTGQLDAVRYNVLAEMTFNLGIGSLLTFTHTLAAVQAGKYDEAARLMLCSRWASQVGQRAKRLALRMKSGED